MEFKLTKHKNISLNSTPYIIAELGSNHNGDMDLAKKLIIEAKRCGADCVKFQSWTKDTIFSKKKYQDNYFLADDYRNRQDTNLEDIVEKYSISEEQLLEMKLFANEQSIDFATTPFSKKEVDFLVEKLDAPFIKIASMDLNNYPFLEYVGKKNKPIVLSTGLSDLSEIDKAIQTIEKTGNNRIIILHCVAIYPAPDESINLNIIDTLKKLYPYPIGFSDHSLGTSIPLAAIAKGSCLIEKHFTLDKNLEGWDHKVSATPSELQYIVNESLRIYKSLGNSRVVKIEDNNRINEFRRSIVASRNISKGEIFDLSMLDFKRPGTGLEPENIKFIIGKKSTKDIEYDSIISIDDF